MLRSNVLRVEQATRLATARGDRPVQTGSLKQLQLKAWVEQSSEGFLKDSEGLLKYSEGLLKAGPTATDMKDLCVNQKQVFD